jgi:type VI protein secretion system component VasF
MGIGFYGVECIDLNLSFSYTGFGSLRGFIANHYGYKLSKFNGYGGNKPFSDVKEQGLRLLFEQSDTEANLEDYEVIYIYEDLKKWHQELEQKELNDDDIEHYVYSFMEMLDNCVRRELGLRWH